MTVDLVPNREIVEDVYQDGSDNEDADTTDEDEESSEGETAFIRSLAQEIKETDLFTKQASEEKASASARLAMLENYARSLERTDLKTLKAASSCIVRSERKCTTITLPVKLGSRIWERSVLRYTRNTIKPCAPLVEKKEKWRRSERRSLRRSAALARRRIVLKPDLEMNG